MLSFLKRNKFSLYVISAFLVYLIIIFPFLRGKLDFPQTIQISLINIRLYSFFILIGIAVAGFMVEQESAGQKDMKDLKLDEALVWMIIPGIIFARLWHVITDFHLYQDKLIDALYVWNGGLGIFGGMVGGVLGAYLYTRKRKVNLIKGLELTSIFFPLAHMIGRLGNFANQELYGGATSLPWGQYINAKESYHHPAFLYEQIGNMVLFLILYNLYKRRGVKSDGFFILLYLFGYSIVRFAVDMIRLEPNIIWKFSTAQLTSIVLMIVIIVYYLFVFRNGKGNTAAKK